MIFSDEAQKHLWNKIPGKYQTTAAIVISITLVVGGLLFFKSNPATPTTQESTESPCSISTIGQSGGTNNVDCKTEAEPQVVSQKSWLNEYKLGLYKQKLELKISNSPDDPSKLTASVQLLDQNNLPLSIKYINGTFTRGRLSMEGSDGITRVFTLTFFTEKKIEENTIHITLNSVK